MPNPIRVACLLVASLLLGSIALAAEPALPNLVGTWSSKSEGTLMVSGKDPGANVHWGKGQATLTGELVITEQQGRVVKGTFTSPKAKEAIVGAIGSDGKTFYLVDTDGYVDARIVDADTIEFVYRHATPRSSVVSVGTWSRKK
jgi:hypothetical protein